MNTNSGVFDVEEQTHSAISIQMPMTQQSEVLQSAFNGSQEIDQNYLQPHGSLGDSAIEKEEYFQTVNHEIQLEQRMDHVVQIASQLNLSRQQTSTLAALVEAKLNQMIVQKPPPAQQMQFEDNGYGRHRRLPIEKRTQLWLKNKEQKLQGARSLKEVKEVEGCTFEPYLHRRSIDQTVQGRRASSKNHQTAEKQ